MIILHHSFGVVYSLKTPIALYVALHVLSRVLLGRFNIYDAQSLKFNSEG